jgi:hypothetical protein
MFIAHFHSDSALSFHAGDKRRNQLLSVEAALFGDREHRGPKYGRWMNTRGKVNVVKIEHMPRGSVDEGCLAATDSRAAPEQSRPMDSPLLPCLVDKESDKRRTETSNRHADPVKKAVLYYCLDVAWQYIEGPRSRPGSDRARHTQVSEVSH